MKKLLSIGDIMYRATASINPRGDIVRVRIVAYKVAKLTTAGAWLVDADERPGAFSRESCRRWMKWPTFAAYAWPTEEEAMESLRRRALCSLKHARLRYSDAKKIVRFLTPSMISPVPEEASKIGVFDGAEYNEW